MRFDVLMGIDDSARIPGPSDDPNATLRLMTDHAVTELDGSVDAAARALREVWDEHPDEGYRRDLSHWQGHGRWDEAAWADLVDTAGRRVRELYRTAGMRIEQMRPVAVDWGCGGGATALALAPLCSRLYAVDVSSKNLAEAGRQLAATEDAPPMIPILVGGDPVDVASAIDQPIDLFVSIATFHLLPTKALGTEILRTAFATMAPGALGYVTIRYDDGTPRYSPREGYERYHTDHVFAASWGVIEFWSLLDQVGFAPLKVSHVNLGSHFCSFFFRK
jgi:SAM-dependent methyltransferase